MAIRHVNKIDKLFFVVLDVKVEEFNQKSMNSENISADSYLSMKRMLLF